jgi:hypothetical protein
MSTAMLIVFILIQFIALLVLALVPFGFDHPSSFGLDYLDFLMVALFYCLALLCGVTVSIAAKRWWIAAAQFAIALVVVLIFFWPWIYPSNSNQPPIPPAEEEGH